jgi:predicted nucleic acid-binding protein
MADAFDSNVLIYAATEGPLRSAAAESLANSRSRIGSVILLPEVLTKPLQRGDRDEVSELMRILATFDLKAMDEEIADASVAFGAKYGLRAPDAIHLATAVVWGAERFYTHNTKVFGDHITEIDVVPS